MAVPRINVTDSEAWGKLVKTWATGKNYVDHPATDVEPVPTEEEIPPKYPKPTSFPDFVAQTVRAKVGLVFEDGQDTPVRGDEAIGFVLLQATSDTSVLRLPAKEKIEESESKLLGGERYLLPSFYERIFDRPAGIVDEQVKTALQIMQLHAERVGEYTINTCH